MLVLLSAHTFSVCLQNQIPDIAQLQAKPTYELQIALPLTVLAAGVMILFSIIAYLSRLIVYLICAQQSTLLQFLDFISCISHLSPNSQIQGSLQKGKGVET